MAKNILIFSDGTGQAGGLRPDQRLTNIYKLYRATRTGPDSPIDPAKQIAFYDPGLGSGEQSGPFLSHPVTSIRKLLSSGFGTGFTRNVADCYEAILRFYEPGDRIYLFGFSRGAYTARSIAGLVHNLGILRRCNMPQVSIAYGHYKDRSDGWRPKGTDAARFRSDYCHPWPVKIRFLGVWDTVGALGAPYGEFLGYLVDKMFGCSFHNVTLSESVDSAYHAVAADGEAADCVAVELNLL